MSRSTCPTLQHSMTQVPLEMLCTLLLSGPCWLSRVDSFYVLLCYIDVMFVHYAVCVEMVLKCSIFVYVTIFIVTAIKLLAHDFHTYIHVYIHIELYMYVYRH